MKGAWSASLNKQMQTYCHYHGEQSEHNTRTQLMAGDDYVAEFPQDEQSYIFCTSPFTSNSETGAFI